MRSAANVMNREEEREEMVRGTCDRETRGKEREKKSGWTDKDEVEIKV